ncbi:hemolysin XhlA family protein [Paenibacillus sp. D2_2]|uniref:hemolysin XhlA family protein n=1 Tax=Paenibacillus sp. D2_2 TaxID=3073092 RepID=UPI002815A3E8|nr:hemolysin XhlA family protein [Paenibacillus sp. D2_2]WMT39740.1 hemolysin XhlA family protein [Paenibacillus sp. D2_2]
MDAVQAETLQRITRVETKVDGMDEKLDRAIHANETATEALEKAKSAHKRIDSIYKIIFWLGTTVVGAIILAVLKLVTEGRG